MILRDALPDDAVVIAAIMADWLAVTPWIPKLHTSEATMQFARDLVAAQTVRMAEVAEGVGFLARDSGEVNALFVAQAVRGRGIGRALIEGAKATGPLALWTFQANPAAQRFYRRAGLREVGRTDGAGNFEKLPDVRMEWAP
ncbi:MAG: GNAT family N-acetyltransferase [Candidatus Saccharibacteria bacterium]|nr:GNAT family N-acetyltransferase [Pseudorhodobacter sp.]